MVTMIPKRMVTYFILEPEQGLVKIGQTTDITNRVKSLQTANAHELRLLLVLDSRPPFEEAQLQWRFRNHKIRGEWYEYGREIQQFVLAKQADPRPMSNDDLALSGDDDRPGFAYKETPNLLEASERSPLYRAHPRWRSDSTSQDYWNGFRIKDEV